MALDKSDIPGVEAAKEMKERELLTCRTRKAIVGG